MREQLLELDGVLVWVNPIQEGLDRSKLDPLLAEVAAAGVWVSAHPEVILKLGTKEVLYRTRDLSCGTDTHLYRTLDELASSSRPVERERAAGVEAVPRHGRHRRLEGRTGWLTRSSACSTRLVAAPRRSWT